MTPATEALPALLDKKQLAIRWGCSTKSVDRRVAERLIVPIRIGRLVRFGREDVLAAEKKMRG